MARHGLPALVGGSGPVLNSTIDMKNKMLVYRARVADRGFSPMFNQGVRVFRGRGISLVKFVDSRVGSVRSKREEKEGGEMLEQGDFVLSMLMCDAVLS